MAKTPKQPAEQDALREDDAPPPDAPETPQPPQDEPAALADQASGDDKAQENAPDAEPDHAAHHENGQPHIDLALFCASHPAKHDQLAGFAYYARDKYPSKYTREQWDAHLAAFNDRPIR